MRARDWGTGRQVSVFVAVSLVIATVLSGSGYTQSNEPNQNSAELELSVIMSKGNYKADEPIVPRVLLKNYAESDVELGSLDWKMEVYRLNRSSNERVKLEFAVTSHSYMTEPVQVSRGQAILLAHPFRLWTPAASDRIEMGPGAYAVKVNFRALGGDISAVETFTVGNESDSEMESAGGIGLPAEEEELQNPSPAESGGYGFFYPKWESLPVFWVYNNRGEPDPHALGEINRGIEAWEAVPGNWFDLEFDGWTNKRPWDVDGVSTIGWRSSGFSDSSLWAEVKCVLFGGLLYECDQAFNTGEDWSLDGSPATGEIDLRSVATHEAGHWIQLKDLYNPGHDSYESWMGDGNEDMTMYGLGTLGSTRQRSLEWGDKAGVRYVYPDRHHLGDTTPQVAGVASAMGDVNSNDVPDLFWAYVIGGYAEQLCYMLGDQNQGGNPDYRQGWCWEELDDLSIDTIALGMAVGQINLDTRLDALFVWVQAPQQTNADRVWYQWARDLDEEAVPGSFSPRHLPFSIGHETQGVGACITEIDGPFTEPDAVVAWIDNPSGGNDIHYRIGYDIEESGYIPSWSSVHTAPGGTIGDESQGLGITCADLDANGNEDLVFAWVDNPLGGNRIRYRVLFNPDIDGIPAHSTQRQGPGADRSIGDETLGLGLADGELDNAPDGELIPETFFAYVDNVNGCSCAMNDFRVMGEWNGRVTSHR